LHRGCETRVALFEMRARAFPFTGAAVGRSAPLWVVSGDVCGNFIYTLAGYHLNFYLCDKGTLNSQHQHTHIQYKRLCVREAACRYGAGEKGVAWARNKETSVKDLRQSEEAFNFRSPCQQMCVAKKFGRARDAV
jgi:hypothetical protein